MYYIGNGTFRLVFEERYFHELETYAEELNENLKPNLNLKQMEVNLLACICIVNCPEDISDVDSLFAFGKALNSEALLRLRDETYGFISPEVFIPAAEKNGTIHKIGEYVLEEVCQFIASKDFKELGMEYIEVNLSVAQCMEQGLSRKVMEMLKKYQISTRSINLEIAETFVKFIKNANA